MGSAQVGMGRTRLPFPGLSASAASSAFVTSTLGAPWVLACQPDGHHSRGICGSAHGPDLSFRHSSDLCVDSLHVIGLFAVHGSNDGISLQDSRLSLISVAARWQIRELRSSTTNAGLAGPLHEFHERQNAQTIVRQANFRCVW
jgi:hypothetical protein